MAGLLGDVLPWVYRTGNEVKGKVKGLLSDPKGFVGNLEQDAMTARDQSGAATYQEIARQDPNLAARVYPTMAKSDKKFVEQQALLHQNRIMEMALNGMTVYHGSPHKFDKFDMSKIGTGEGAQAYGHGLYFAENPTVATEYQRQLSSKFKDHPVLGLVEKRAFNEAGAAKYPDAKGALYKVDLPDEAIAKMLDWDKPLSQQSSEVQDAIRKVPHFQEYLQAGVLDGPGAKNLGVAIDSLRHNHPPAALTDALRAAGIPGIRYLDGGSRTGGKGTSNFVVFDDQLPKIVERK